MTLNNKLTICALVPKKFHQSFRVKIKILNVNKNVNSQKIFYCINKNKYLYPIKMIFLHNTEFS